MKYFLFWGVIFTGIWFFIRVVVRGYWGYQTKDKPTVIAMVIVFAVLEIGSRYYYDADMLTVVVRQFKNGDPTVSQSDTLNSDPNLPPGQKDLHKVAVRLPPMPLLDKKPVKPSSNRQYLRFLDDFKQVEQAMRKQAGNFPNFSIHEQWHIESNAGLFWDGRSRCVGERQISPQVKVYFGYIGEEESLLNRTLILLLEDPKLRPSEWKNFETYYYFDAGLPGGIDGRREQVEGIPNERVTFTKGNLQVELNHWAFINGRVSSLTLNNHKQVRYYRIDLQGSQDAYKKLEQCEG